MYRTKFGFRFANVCGITVENSRKTNCFMEQFVPLSSSRTRILCSVFDRCVLFYSRRKVQKLRDQSQYISKNVRALQYWRWACGTCCKQYHMLFYIQMAVVSTAIFFLFSPSFSFFLEIKVQIYIYFHNKCQYINQFPPKP